MARAASSVPLRPSIRTALAVAVAALLAAVVAACGGGTPAPQAAPPPTGAGFPVTIQHAFGETTIQAEPKRVVAVGFNEADFVLALGVVPVGVRDFIGAYDEAQRPWARAVLNGASPEVVGGNEIGIEKVAALRPDLILGVYSFMDEAVYQTLSKIAPTMPAPDASGSAASWQEQTRITGWALGRQAKAEEVIAATEQKFAAARAAYPQLAGKSLGLDLVVGGETYVLGADDLRTQVFRALGLDVGPSTQSLSAEQLSLLDKDAIAVMGAPREALAGNQVFQNLNAVKTGRVVYLGGENTPLAGAIGFGSPLSLPYAIDVLAPQLAAAYRG